MKNILITMGIIIGLVALFFLIVLNGSTMIQPTATSTVSVSTTTTNQSVGPPSTGPSHSSAGNPIPITWNPIDISSSVVEVNTIELLTENPYTYSILDTSTTTNDGEYEWSPSATDTGVVFVEVGCYQGTMACQALPLYGPFMVQ